MPAEAQQRHFKAGFLQERLKEGQWRSETRLQTLVPANKPLHQVKAPFLQLPFWCGLASA